MASGVADDGVPAVMYRPTPTSATTATNSPSFTLVRIWCTSCELERTLVTSAGIIAERVARINRIPEEYAWRAKDAALTPFSGRWATCRINRVGWRRCRRTSSV